MADTQTLVADIGGTNTRVALAEAGQLVPASIRHFRNSEHDGLVPLLRRYLEETGAAQPRAACLAMAGPVRDGKGQLTNLDWTLDTETLADATGARTVALLNDLQAQGHALGHLPQSALQVILPGPPPNLAAAQLVVGLGTGFNAAPVYNHGGGQAGGRLVPPSEAGHAALPVRTRDDLDLAQYIAERHGFCSIEDALSGRGLKWIHDFLCERDGVSGGAGSAEVMRRMEDGADAEAARAEAAVAHFIRLAGGVCGDLALTLLPFGGIFLIGGMARAIAPYMPSMGFAEAFRDKGRFGPFMSGFPVTLITDDDAALIGSAVYLEGLLAARAPA